MGIERWDPVKQKTIRGFGKIKGFPGGRTQKRHSVIADSQSFLNGIRQPELKQFFDLFSSVKIVAEPDQSRSKLFFSASQIRHEDRSRSKIDTMLSEIVSTLAES